MPPIHRLRTILAFLYPDRHAAVLAALEHRLASHPAPPPPADPSDLVPWDERDALLITYADQITEPERSPLATLRAFAARHLRDVVGGIHLLPFYPSSSDDGFSVMDYTAVDPRCGTWDDIRAFRPDFELMFDAVFNHASAQGGWFRACLAGDPDYADFFYEVHGDPDLRAVVRPRTLPLLTEFDSPRGRRRFWTTFSADQVDLDFRNPAVLIRVVDVLLGYLRNGARFLRLDAVTFLWKEPGTSCVHLPRTHAIVQVLRAVAEAVDPRSVIVTETNVPHADNVGYFGDGTDEAHMVYNFALPGLVLHAVRTGNATPLSRWAASLRTPSETCTFFNFLASHDGIGLNGVRGILPDADVEALVRHVAEGGGLVSYKRLPDGTEAPYELNVSLLDAVAPRTRVPESAMAARRFLTVHAAMLALRGIPGLYVHSVLGSRGDLAGARESGMHRRINRRKFLLGTLERELADPRSLPALMLAGFQALLRPRRSHPAFHPNAPQEILAWDDRIFALRRQPSGGGAGMLCLHNLGDEAVPLPRPSGFATIAPLPPALAPWETLWRETVPAG